jgi:predicted ester cyclase
MPFGAAAPNLQLGGLVTMDDSAGLDRQLYEKVWNEGDIDDVETLIDPNLVFNGARLSPAQYRDWATGFRRAFPDLHVQIEPQIAAGATVASRLTWRGTNTGELAAGLLPGWQGSAIAPTGRAVNWTAISMHRFDSGRLIEGWLDADFLSLLQQLGVIAPLR